MMTFLMARKLSYLLRPTSADAVEVLPHERARGDTLRGPDRGELGELQPRAPGSGDEGGAGPGLGTALRSAFWPALEQRQCK